jgi:serine/threonine-protein kinase RsbW
MDASNNRDEMRRILGRVTRSEFVGRADELARIVSQANRGLDGRGLLILLEPLAGVSELLRQTYDELFNNRTDVIPIYFAVPRSEGTAVSIAIAFLRTFLIQYLAFRRDEPSLSHAPLTLSDVLKLAPATDYEWIEQLLETYNERRFGDDDQALITFCLSAPQRVPRRNGRPFVMIEAVKLAGRAGNESPLDTVILRTLDRSGLGFALAGLRRQILNAAHEAGCDFESLDFLRLERLAPGDAKRLVEIAARRQNIELNEETRDLLVHQFECSPFFMTSLLQAAREKSVALTTFLSCEQLYVDELMGGHLHRYFTDLLESIAPQLQTRRLLIRLLVEASSTDSNKSSVEAWGKLLHLDSDELERLLGGLHVQELLNRDGVLIQAGVGPTVWNDYLKVRFRLDIQNEPRALVVADTIATTLKRAPHTMATHYRRALKIQLRDFLAGFNTQLVPGVLLDYDRFKQTYRGASEASTMAQLDAETDMVRLPQVFYTAAAAAYSPQLSGWVDDHSCVVAHAFEGATYADAYEVVWLAAQIDAKLEVDRELTQLWCERLQNFANECGFARIQIMLISNEGFTPEAADLLRKRSGYGVSRRQVDLLAARLGEMSPVKPTSEPNEYVAILPMGDDNELLAASIVEQIARKSNFRTEAINQIKTAIVEACINAAEHSLSPDRKIYQRFRVESDRLVITISSRGVVPAKQSIGEGTQPAEDIELTDERRGWGLKLIRSLMDEVEFEQVDDGTSLRMTKYLRPTSL